MSYTVNKLRSINLLFSGMFHIELNIVTVGAEKFIMLYQEQVHAELGNFSFTFIGAEDYATSEKWQKKFHVFFYCSLYKCKCGAVVESLT